MGWFSGLNRGGLALSTIALTQRFFLGFCYHNSPFLFRNSGQKAGSLFIQGKGEDQSGV